VAYRLTLAGSLFTFIFWRKILEIKKIIHSFIKITFDLKIDYEDMRRHYFPNF
jgi:hypothetical protein